MKPLIRTLIISLVQVGIQKYFSASPEVQMHIPEKGSAFFFSSRHLSLIEQNVCMIFNKER
jgi:hypothetical protein